MSEAEPQPEQPQPSKRRHLRRRWIVLIVVASVLVLLVAASLITAHYTSRSSFCDSCHEMEPYYASWQASLHSEAECVDCHIPPGFTAWVKTKLFAFREIWVHITDKVESPLAVTREIPNGSCQRCHKIPDDLALGNETFSHRAHESEYCISCHVRIVHTTVNPPYFVEPGDMSTCFECHDGIIASESCAACHTPEHESWGECDSCHTLEAWDKVTFEHPFPTTGGHADLTCQDCHEAKAGVETIPGTNLARPPTACVSCHGDRHGGLNDCLRCHSVAGWIPANFSHPFPLTGGHAGLACQDCHKAKAGAETIPGTNLARAPAACISCHGDRHGGLTDCSRCHSVAGWKPANFRHPQVGEHYPSGEHRLSCSSCHPSGYGSYSCSRCHSGGTGGEGDDD